MPTIVNLTVYLNTLGHSSGPPITVPIPATTAGNTLIVCFANSEQNGLFNIPDVQDNTADLFANAVIDGSGTVCSSGISYATGIAGGATEITVDADVTLNIWVLEITPATLVTVGETDYEGTVVPTADGPILTSANPDDLYISVVGARQITPDNSEITGVTAGWTLNALFGTAGSLTDTAGAIAYKTGTGDQQAIFDLLHSADNWAVTGAVFNGGSSPPPPPTPPPCAPVNPQGHLTAGVLIDDLDLFIGPATALYDTYLAPPQIADYETGAEGRREIVLDFNQSDGVYARDLGTAFSWPLITQGKPKTVLFAWQPSVIPMPEGVYGRATDWMDGGTAGAKYIQGIMVEGDSFGNAKSFVLQDSDTLQFHALNELPAIFTKQTVKAFSCVVPFVAHSARLIANDGVEWRVWQTSLVFEPWPELCRNWQAEMTSLELTGWGHVREMNIPHVSTADLTLVLTFDSWPTITLTIPNSGGRQVKQKVTLPANKFKLMQPRIFSTEDFRLFEKDLELKIKSWGSYDFYRISKPFGGPSREGALV